MFTLMDKLPDRNCQGHSRREFLRIGSLGWGGLTLPGLLAAGAQGAEAGRVLRGRSVVLLFLQGGPPQIELFDPKMTAPSNIRSITGELRTSLPGVTFGGTFPRLARLAHKFTVVRSYGSGNAAHNYLSVASGGNSMKAALGAVYARVAGITNPQTGLPNNTLLLPEAVEPGLELGRNFETSAMPTLTDPGTLGPSYAAFNPLEGGQLQDNMQLRIAPQRLDDRRVLLASLDEIKRLVDATGVMESVDRFRQQAFDLLTRGVADAFDLSKEDARTLERYDTTKLFDARKLQRWGDMRRVTNLLGRQMLLARRLCEAGCGFVTVSDCGWDYHSDNDSPKYMAGIYPMGHQVDRAVSAFIEDVEARGLRDKILLIVTGEMGRTPHLNKNGGRDHHGALTSLLLYGGGLKGGQVIGASDRNAAEPASEPYGPKNLLATVMHTLFDVGALRLQSGLPQELILMADQAEPIRELF